MSQKAAKRTRRRKPGPFDPIEIYQQQPDLLESRLEDLEVDQLKDIIAEHGMDRSRLAMRWKTKKRLVDLIIESVKNKVQKGEEFRKTMSDDSEEDMDKKQWDETITRYYKLRGWNPDNGHPTKEKLESLGMKNVE